MTKPRRHQGSALPELRHRSERRARRSAEIDEQVTHCEWCGAEIRTPSTAPRTEPGR